MVSQKNQATDSWILLQVSQVLPTFELFFIRGADYSNAISYL